MEPNFHDREYLVIDELSYRFHEPTRGEIVVFRPPGGKQYFIKRVIGVPGDTVTIARGTVTVADAAHPGGYLLDESSYVPGVYTQGEMRVTLGGNEYFLMGDNRSSSLDSRSFGPVPRANIVGRVWIRGWPLEKLGTIGAASYPIP
jgi:signal peptidase I